MKALLLILMLLVSMTAFSQRTDSREKGMALANDSLIVLQSDSVMAAQPYGIDHAALAKSYKSTSRKYGVAAFILGIAGLGATWYGVATNDLGIDLSGMRWNEMNTRATPNTRSSGSDSSDDDQLSEAMLIVGAACVATSIFCCVKSIIYHNKSKKELKLTVRGTTASIAFTF